MSWLHVVVAGVAGLASMRTAIERGDVDEAARQGMLAGPVVIEEALAAADRPTRLAAIAAAPSAAGRAELLDALARSAGGPDRRTAIPAGAAARTIARELARTELPDDLDASDVIAWRDGWAELAARTDRWITLRVLALDTAAALDRAAGNLGLGVPLQAALDDRDPAYRQAAIAVVPVPVPASMHGAIAKVVVDDADPGVALAAAQILCADLAVDPPKPVLAALGPAGITRLRSLVTGPASRTALRDLNRCLGAAPRK